MFRLLNASFALVLGCALSGAAVARADEPPAPRDDALDRLLEKLEKPDRPPADTKPDSEPPKGEAAKPAGEAKPDGEKKPAGELAPKDQALDSLLEKLGETRDKPDAPNDRRAPRGMPGEEKEGKDQAPAPAKPGEPKPQDLTGKSKDLDEHLEELTGRKRKKKDQDEQEGSGPLSKVIKEMREVEQRLGKPDTGEETRKKQTEIVKNLEQLIEQLRNSSSQSRGLRIRMVRQAGQQPGQPQGGTTGANAGGVGPSKPARPDGKHANVGDKDIWGHLPPELRQEMDNIAKEGMLPTKEELIRRYLLSVAKKSLNREE
jgi:hypothetical protein